MREGFFLNHPAKGWETGLPVGNGRQGAVLFGTAETEKILLNEESLWYGGKQERGQEAGREKLTELRSLLAEGKAEEAQRLCGRYLSSYPRYMNPYHPAAEAVLTFWGMEAEGEGEAYRRGLDLEEGEVWVESGTQRRVLFSSSHYQVTVLHLESERGKRWNMELGLNRRPFEQEAESAEDAIYLSGQSGEGGVHYCVGCMAGESDGSWKVEGGYLVLQEASFAELLFCVCTDYEGGDAKAACKNRLERAKAAGYEEVYARHKRDYAAQYNRMQLQLSFDEEVSKLPADVLLKRAGEPKVRAYLTQLLFAYARYLLISSSTNCLLPANLQGIWNGSFTPPWESGYTININLQMNYWMADAAGLGECFEPFLSLLERMLPNGRETARKVYGCEGFVAHHNTNLWGDTDITGLWIPAACWVTGGAWMANQVYQHASYEENEKEIRERILPILGEALRFFHGYLQRESDGSLVSGPSVSPENVYCLPDGQRASVSMGPTMDHQIIRELAENYLEGCHLYGKAEDCEEVLGFAKEIAEKLPKTAIGADGRILEWRKDYKEAELGHRHISHLYGLYPGREICEENPSLWEGAKKTLECRLQHGGGHTGWSRAWIQCFYARLKEAEKLDEQLRLFFENSVAENLWDVHPPFQIDGNFGMAAAVLEALAVRRGDRVELLPALPSAFPKGRVKGQRLKGRLVLDYAWEEGQLSHVSLYSGKEQTLTLCYASGSKELYIKAGEKLELCFKAKKA